MAEQVRRRHRVRKSPWSVVERVMFALAALFTLLSFIFVLVGIAELVKGVGGDKPRGTITTTNADEAPTEAPTEQPMDSELARYIGDEGFGGKIYEQLSVHPEAAYVLRNLDLYPEEVLTFVTRFPEAMPYAAGYPDYIATGIRPEIDLTGEVEKGTMPMLIQWDNRWGYCNYGEGMMGYSGCGPTCMSMVSIYLTGYHDNDPLSVATFAAENGYYTKGSGTAWSFMSQASINFGLVSQELSHSESKVIEAVEAGRPVILKMNAGYFTDNGHFIVVFSHSDEGFEIRDPNSPANSSRLWQWSELSGEIGNLWVYDAA